MSAFNEKEKPTPAVLLVGVVNRSVITMADNKTDRLMPTHFLISGEVKHPAELEHADFLLTDHPKAAEALDLLLATQGWRRFAEQNADPVNPADKPDVDKMLVAHGQRTSAPFALYKLEEQRVNAEYRPKLEVATIALVIAQTDWAQRRNAPDAAAELAVKQAAATRAEQQYTTAAADLYPFETRATRPPSWGLPALAVALFALCIGGTALAASRPSGSRRPYYFGTFGLFALAALTVAGVVQTWSTPETEMAWKQTGRGDDGRQKAALTEEREQANAGQGDRGAGVRSRWPESRPECRGDGGLGMPGGGAMPMAPAGSATATDGAGCTAREAGGCR